ncbi:MAG: cytidine/deoxycytidylate deaminase family protein [Candidatus Thermoplasmatota archaeon]|nr:cytidine/deoxycytidylate deaminase family protein [Candidatus Thermoplasmatota archaeon]
MDRPSKDEYFMRMAFLASTRATCLRRKVGAVVVKDGHVLSTGYNGAPKGMDHCETTGCLRKEMGIPSGERHEICRGLHAEQNAVIQAAAFGVSIAGSKMYITNHPCTVCAKMLINAGIMEVIYSDDYVDELAKRLLLDGGVSVRRYKLQDMEP